MMTMASARGVADSQAQGGSRGGQKEGDIRPWGTRPLLIQSTPTVAGLLILEIGCQKKKEKKKKQDWAPPVRLVNGAERTE